MANVLKVLRDERKVVSKRLSALDTAIAALAGDVRKTAKRIVSAASRAKMAKAQKARWAKIKKG
jgi:hypothetical protein